MAENQYNFNVQTHPEILQAYNQAANNIIQSQQTGFEDKMALYKTIADSTSKMVQSFVEQAKYRQQRDAVAALQSFNPNQPVTRAIESTTPGPESFPQTDYQQTTLGQTPEGQDLQRQLAARVVSLNPQEASKAIIAQQLPGKMNLSDLAAYSILHPGQGPSTNTVAQTAQEMQKLPNTETRNMILDGKGVPRPFNYVPGRGGTPGIYTDDNGTRIDASRLSSPSPTNSTQEGRDTAEADKIQKEMNSLQTSSRQALGQAAIVNRRTALAMSQLNDPNIKPQQLYNVYKDMDSIYSGGIAQGAVPPGMIYNTLASKWANLKTLVTSNPQAINTPEVVQSLKDSINGLQQASNQTIGQNTKFVTAAHQQWIQRHPDQWQKFLDATADTVTPADSGGSVDAIAKLLNLKKKKG